MGWFNIDSKTLGSNHTTFRIKYNREVKKNYAAGGKIQLGDSLFFGIEVLFFFLITTFQL